MMKKAYLIIASILVSMAGCQVKAKQEDKKNEASDAEHQIKDSVKIGDQTWTSMNLDLDNFQNGEKIVNAKSNDQWITAGLKKQPAWCYFQNKADRGIRDGKLYNWYAINDSRGLAPPGWRVATMSDWEKLINYLGDKYHVGRVLKSKTGWINNGNGTDSLGFSIYPAGIRASTGEFSDTSFISIFWSSTELDATDAQSYRALNSIKGLLKIFDLKSCGFSVRLVKDNN